MMLGRDVSMPNLTRNPDLTSVERERVHMISARLLNDDPLTISSDELRLLAQAAQTYVPLPVPAAPQAVMHLSHDDRTMPVGQVIGVIEDESSDGVCEPSQDGPTGIATLDHTSMHRDKDGNGYIVKRGAAEKVAIPNVNDITKR